MKWKQQSKEKSAQHWEIQVNKGTWPKQGSRRRRRVGLGSDAKQAQRNVNNSLNLQLHAHLAHTHTPHTHSRVRVMLALFVFISECISQIQIRVIYPHPCAYGIRALSPQNPDKGEWRHLMFAHIMTRPIRFCNHKPIGNTFGIRTKKGGKNTVYTQM